MGGFGIPDRKSPAPTIPSQSVNQLSREPARSSPSPSPLSNQQNTPEQKNAYSTNQKILMALLLALTSICGFVTTVYGISTQNDAKHKDRQLFDLLISKISEIHTSAMQTAIPPNITAS
jgi:hypothetical protein